MPIPLAIIHFSWLCATFMDAITFEKVYGEDMYNAWHAAKVFAYFTVYFYILHHIGANAWLYPTIVVTLHVQHEFFYRLFRFWDVYKLDNRYRSLWLEKLIKHWWEYL